uniref:Discs, large (Drosophila) homolog-associated protein 4b n=1 Tax=Sphaeramia orbicularis TaxID=375764 RepID=A0A672ZHP7_9TELE
MKGLGTNRNRHLSDSCDPSSGHPEALYPQKTSTLPRSPYLLSPTMDHYGTMDPHHYPSANPGSLPPDCMLPLNNQLSNSSTFPRIHYNSYDQSDFSPPGDTTISHHMTKNETPQSLLEFDKQLPGGRDGFSTLQFHRTSAVAAAKQRTDSPGRIRYMLHSVQKLFAKSQSLESHNMKGNVNGRSAGSGGGSSGTDDGGKHNRRSKSKDRGTKSEATAKRRPRSNMSGYWSSDDLDSSDLSSYHNTMAMMTLGRPTGHDSQGGQGRYIHSGYNTISSSKSSNDMKYQPLSGPGGNMVLNDSEYMKGGSWSTLTMGQPRHVIQKGSATLDRSMLKSKSCQQELTCNYLQVGRRGDWSSTLGRPGAPNEIPCRRMRSGSYVKAMGDMEDSDDSEGSPKPSPKSAARRQSYLRATQQSLSDHLSPLVVNVLFLCWVKSLYGSVSVPTLSLCPLQLRDLDLTHHYEDRSSESTFRDSRSHSQDNPEPPDLPMPTCFRSRSHSYLRAIQAGCSQDDDTASIDSGSPPPIDTTVRTYSTSTVSTCITTCKKAAPPPVPPRTTSKPYISVTVQSSTESAQDNYLDQQDRRSEVNSQSSHAHSNSSDSLDSTRANSLARGIPRPPHIIPTPIAIPREPIALATVSTATETSDAVVQHEFMKSGLSKGNLAAEEPLVAPVPRRKLSSIGIQVGYGAEHPVCFRLSRSSSMASKQETDSDTQDIPVIAHINNAKSTEKKVMVNSASQSMSSPPGQDSLDNGDTTGDTSLDPALDPSSLPPPDPWLESGNGSNSSAPQSGGGGTLCRRDGHWFLKLLQAETGRMEGWCQQMEQETKDNQLSDEVLGKVRSAVGSAQLLISQKFQQFRGLCEQNLNVNANPRPTAQDLAGFWDLLQLSIEDISLKFDELYHLKSNDWQPVPSAAAQSPPERKVLPTPAAQCPGWGRKAAETEKQRQEARKRLLAAKKAASFRQNSATESADSIEIYVPEAQTRL